MNMRSRRIIFIRGAQEQEREKREKERNNKITLARNCCDIYKDKEIGNNENLKQGDDKAINWMNRSNYQNCYDIYQQEKEKFFCEKCGKLIKAWDPNSCFGYTDIPHNNEECEEEQERLEKFKAAVEKK